MFKIKQTVSIIALLAASASIPAFADMPAPQGPVIGPVMMHGHKAWMHHHDPMMRHMMNNAPIPMLMPVVLHHAFQLKLTPAQNTQIQQMIQKQRHQFPAWQHAMMTHNAALRKALLAGESGKALTSLEAAVVKDQSMMLNHGVMQVEYLHKILTPVQWQKAVKMADHPWGHHGMWHHKP